MLSINFKLTSLILLALCSCYFLQAYFSKKYLNRNSKLLAAASQKHVQTVQESYASIRDLIIDNSQNYFIANYSNIDVQMRRYEANMQFVQAFPKYVIECFGLVLVAVLCVFLYQTSDSNLKVISTVGSLSLGLQKLLPLLFAMYSSWAILKSYVYAVNMVLDLTESVYKPYKLPLKTNKNFNFKTLEIRNLNFKYHKKAQYILKI